MGNTTGQIELPSTPGRAKQAKKQRIRKLRKQAKCVFSTNPMFNKYHGYA